MHLAGAVAEAAHLDHDVDRARDLLPHGLLRQVEARHRDHRLEPAQRVARRVGVDGGERAVVAGVHGLEHVHGLAAAALAHDDAVGPHTQGVDQEQALGHLARAFDVGRAGLQPDHVRLLELKLGRVLDRDDPLGGRNERREDVEQRRLAGAGAARDEHVEPGLARCRCSSSSIGSVGALVAQQVLGR